MKNEIVPIEQAIEHVNCQFTKTALEFDCEISYADWSEVGARLRKAEGAIKYWIGDWINFGARKWKRKKYHEVAKILNLEYGTLANASYVAAQIEPSRRNENLSYSHHVVVAPHSDELRDFYLKCAEERGLSVRGLRDFIKEEEIKKLELNSLSDNANSDSDSGSRQLAAEYVLQCIDIMECIIVNINKLSNKASSVPKELITEMLAESVIYKVKHEVYSALKNLEKNLGLKSDEEQVLEEFDLNFS